MNTKNIRILQTAVHRVFSRPVRTLLTVQFAAVLLSDVSTQAQTQAAWILTSPDNFTNPADWNISAIPTSANEVVLTNGGTINYIAGGPNDVAPYTWTNTIDVLWLGGAANGVGNSTNSSGGGTNIFNMSGGSLTLSDTVSNDFAIGGISTNALSIRSTNIFNMTGGTLAATNSSGINFVGFASNSVATVNFNGGTATFLTLYIGGRGSGTVNINGGTVNILSNATDVCGIGVGSGSTVWTKSSGTLNIISGILNATNSPTARTIFIGNVGVANTLNVSGGTLNCGGISYGAGVSSASVNNTLNVSGGAINMGSGGLGRNGSSDINNAFLSGGTISTLPGLGFTWSGLIPTILTNTPGSGIVTFAPLAGTFITNAAGMAGPGSLNAAGPGQVILTGANTYTGNTTVSGGILSLSTAGSIASTNIIIAGGATFDVSELSSTFTLNSYQTLSNSTSTAMIDGSLNTGSGIVSLTYAAGTPSLTVVTNNSVNANAAPATLTLSPSTAFNINNTGSALTPGNYLIISTNGEGAAVAGTPPGSATVSGGSIQAGNSAILSVSNNELYLMVTALPPPPAIAAQFPVTYTNLFTLYAGASPTFSVSAASAATIYYQWYTNGVGVGGATNAGVTLSNVQAGLLTNYCIVTNIYGSSTSMVWTASVIADPVGAGDVGLAPYPQSVLAANPVGYWRLNDVNEDGSDNGGGDDGYVANDYAGGNDGIYTNVSLGNSSYNPTDDPSDSSAYLGETVAPYLNSLAGQIEGIDFAATNGANAEFSVEAWANGIIAAQVSGGAVITKGTYNVNDAFNLGMDTAATHRYRFYVRNALGTVYTADSTFAPDGNWHHLAGVCDEANGEVSLYIDGKLAASTPIPASSGEYEVAAPVTIGAGITNNAPNGYALQFYGYINDAAVYNYALSANQVANQYANDGDTAPFFIQPAPAGATTYTGGTLVITPMTAAGTGPLGYYWTDVNGGTNVAAGTTNGVLLNAALTVSSVPANWNGDQLELTVTNAYGTTNVYVTLTVSGPPFIATNLPPQITVAQGQSYTYVVGVNGAPPLGYQWFSGASPIATQTNATYTLTAGAAGQFNYDVVITNFLGSATSIVSTLTVLPPPTSAYGTNILDLSPVGYWPMHEVESPAPGDTETNYGFLGLLGTGYYGDWVAGSGSIQRNVPGALANDTNPAVAFPGTAGSFVNCLSVPHASPLATLNPPFSVECWCYPSNANQSGDIWSQCGYEGLNAGSYGGGAGSIAGIRLFWNNPSFYLYTYYTASTLHQVGHIHELPGSWYYVVATCDAQTNITFYVNGVPAFTNAFVGLYTPDYWSPLTLANGKGYNNALPCVMDEFAIYTNALGASDIAQHYNDGTGGAAGAYVSDVTNDHPVVYFRMDSPYPAQPPASLLPVLVNFGSVGVNGVYVPGTAPGLVAGTSYDGFPAGGLSGTNVADLSGVSSFADAGYAAAYNPIGSNAFSVSVIFRGNPADERAQTIVGHTSSSWRLWMNTTGNLQWQIGGTTLGSVGVYNDGNWHQAVAVYAPASNPNVTGTNLLYVDGVLDSSVATVSTNGITPGSTSDVMIGSDPQYTNNPAGLGQQFAGEICEVALFTNALTGSQVQTLYNASPVLPYIDGQPISGRAVYGGTGSYIYFGVDAGGSPSLAYQWYFNANPSYGGATQLVDGAHYTDSATLEVTVTNLTTADSGYYFAVITNNYGSVTSILASLTVTANPNPTNIVFLVTATNLTLSWPADHTGWQLQAQTNNLSVGISTNWVDVANTTPTNQVVIPINLTNGSVFYRLVYPPQ